jgi:hypothetical protein
MFRSRARRRLSAIVAIALLLLAQGLVAAHACALASPAGEVDEAVQPCHHMAPEQPAPDTLCKAHCEAGTQTVDQAKPLAAPDLGAPLVTRRADDLARATPGPALRLTDWLAHAATPPPILLHRRLLI